jgi:hypothetical protein
MWPAGIAWVILSLQYTQCVGWSFPGAVRVELCAPGRLYDRELEPWYNTMVYKGASGSDDGYTTSGEFSQYAGRFERCLQSSSVQRFQQTEDCATMYDYNWAKEFPTGDGEYAPMRQAKPSQIDFTPLSVAYTPRDTWQHQMLAGVAPAFPEAGNLLRSMESQAPERIHQSFRFPIDRMVCLPPCPPNMYYTELQTLLTNIPYAECVRCPAGYVYVNAYVNEQLGTPCERCPRGTSYGLKDGEPTCQLCPPGAPFSQGSTSPCRRCSVNEYWYWTTSAWTTTDANGNQIRWFSDDSECRACPSDQFSNGAEEACSPCKAGSTYNSVQCVECASDTYKGPSDSSCLLCAAGSFSGVGASVCTPFATTTNPGFYLHPPQWYTAETFEYIRSPCAANTYNDDFRGVCKPVEANAYTTGCLQETTDSVTSYVGCTGSACIASYVNVDPSGTLECSSNPLTCGYSSYSEEGVCTDCPGGTGHPSMLSRRDTDCVACVAGTHRGQPGTPCIDCSIGSYQPTAGQTTCTSCAHLLTTNSVASASIWDCVPCSDGTYFDQDSKVCRTCLVGHFCTDGALQPCLRGTAQPMVGSDTCIVCKDQTPMSSTLNDGASACTPCSELSPSFPAWWYSAPGGCEQCLAGSYTTNANTCVECPQGYRCEYGVKTMCDKGTYQPASGQSTCLSCNIPEWSPKGEPALACKNCPSPGQFKEP